MVWKSVSWVCYTLIACTFPTRSSTGVAVHVLCELLHYCSWSLKSAEHRCGLPDVLLVRLVTVQRHGVSLLRAPRSVAVLVLQSTSRGDWLWPPATASPGTGLALPSPVFCDAKFVVLYPNYWVGCTICLHTLINPHFLTSFHFPIMKQYVGFIFNFSIFNKSLLMVMLCFNCQT